MISDQSTETTLERLKEELRVVKLERDEYKRQLSRTRQNSETNRKQLLKQLDEARYEATIKIEENKELRERLHLSTQPKLKHTHSLPSMKSQKDESERERESESESESHPKSVHISIDDLDGDWERQRNMSFDSNSTPAVVNASLRERLRELDLNLRVALKTTEHYRTQVMELQDQIYKSQDEKHALASAIDEAYTQLTTSTPHSNSTVKHILNSARVHVKQLNNSEARDWALTKLSHAQTLLFQILGGNPELTTFDIPAKLEATPCDESHTHPLYKPSLSPVYSSSIDISAIHTPDQIQETPRIPTIGAIDLTERFDLDSNESESDPSSEYDSQSDNEDPQCPTNDVATQLTEEQIQALQQFVKQVHYDSANGDAWTIHLTTDPISKKTIPYFYNRNKSISQWNPPPGLNLGLGI